MSNANTTKNTAISNNVVVYSRLPMSVNVRVNNQTLLINGKNTSGIIGSNYGITYMDRQTWDAIAKQYNKVKWLKNGHVFMSANEEQAKGKAAEEIKRKTGLEEVDPEKFNEDESIISTLKPTKKAGK